MESRRCKDPDVISLLPLRFWSHQVIPSLTECLDIETATRSLLSHDVLQECSNSALDFVPASDSRNWSRWCLRLRWQHRTHKYSSQRPSSTQSKLGPNEKAKEWVFQPIWRIFGVRLQDHLLSYADPSLIIESWSQDGQTRPSYRGTSELSYLTKFGNLRAQIPRLLTHAPSIAYAGRILHLSFRKEVAITYIPGHFSLPR